MALLMADSSAPTTTVLEEGGSKDASVRQRIEKFLDDPGRRTMAMIFLAMAIVCNRPVKTLLTNIRYKE
jgi:hypothetical protein